MAEAMMWIAMIGAFLGALLFAGMLTALLTAIGRLVVKGLPGRVPSAAKRNARNEPHF